MNEPEKTFANGLFGLLQPIAISYQDKIENIHDAQAILAERIDSVTKEMERCMEECQFVDVNQYIQKLQNTRKKIFQVSSSLNIISDRLNRLNKAAAYKFPELQKLQEFEKKKTLVSSPVPSSQGDDINSTPKPSSSTTTTIPTTPQPRTETTTDNSGDTPKDVTESKTKNDEKVNDDDANSQDEKANDTENPDNDQ